VKECANTKIHLIDYGTAVCTVQVINVAVHLCLLWAGQGDDHIPENALDSGWNKARNASCGDTRMRGDNIHKLAATKIRNKLRIVTYLFR